MLSDSATMVDTKAGAPALSMKWLLRNTALYAFALFLLPQIVTGVSLDGGLPTLLIGGFVLTIMLLVVKPVVNIISFPLNLVTLGIFSALVNVIIFYLLTVFVPNITINAFTFEGASYAGFTLPRMYFNLFFSYVVAAAVISLIIGFINWVTK